MSNPITKKIKSTDLNELYNKPVLNKKETSIFLGVSNRHIDNLIYRKSIPFSKIGGRIVFQNKRLIQFLDSTDSLGGMLTQKATYSLDRIIAISDDIKNDTEWVNSSKTKATYEGVCSGLNMLINHLKEIEESEVSK